ncbi:PIG-L family deacetylase [Deinococcus detaillensis]|uniref:PIG-L family deacetylase n=1 Tax=Deinococcus detaillensis TaxID=2592048 RepID=A0A553UH22_9DEIO|nr:PIG-L family deacetylase [Deinococcus detaillensis]
MPAAVVLVLAAWINLPLLSQVFDQSSDVVAALPQVTAFKRGQRLLVLSPHPDDETLCCAGMIQQAQAAGAAVYIVWVTAGDGFEVAAALSQRTLKPSIHDMRALGQLRTNEAHRASAVLGVPLGHTFMLGYPDGGLFALFTTNFEEPYTAPRTGAAKVYVTGALTPSAPFSGQSLEADLEKVLSTVQPDLVLAPAPQDFHPDHRTLSYIALRLLSARHQASRLRFWVVHGGLEWPLPKGLHPKLALTLPPLAAQLPWTQVTLTPGQETLKARATEQYQSQTRIMSRFMHSFVRTNELLSPEAAAEERLSPPKTSP